MENQSLNLTVNEKLFLKAFGESDFFESDIESVIWDYSVNDNLPYSGKVRSGVISSLVQKGILGVQKKEKGEIAGVYWIKDEFRENDEVLKAIFN